MSKRGLRIGVVGWAFLLSALSVPAKDSVRVAELVKDFRYWSAYDLYTDPAFDRLVKAENFELPDYPRKKLEQLFAPGAQVTYRVDESDGAVETLEAVDGLQAYLNHLQQARFMVLIRSAELEAPHIQKADDQTIVTYRELLDDGKVYRVMDTELALNEAGSTPAISSLVRNLRRPTPGELQAGRAALQSQPYNPLAGLGGRYLAGGSYASGAPSWSPDGISIVYSGLAGSSLDLFLVDRSGSTPRQLTQARFWEVEPTFTTSSRNLIFRSDEKAPEGKLYFLDIPTSSIRPLLPEYENPSKPSISSDGKLMALVAGRGNESRVMVANTDGTAARFITPPGLQPEFPLLSPSGDAVYFTGRPSETTTSDACFQDLYVADVATSGVRRLTKKCHRVRAQGIAAEPARLVFVREPESGASEIWALDLESGEEKMLHSSSLNCCSQVAVSPDGKRAIFSSREAAPDATPYVYELFLIELEKPNAKPRQLTSANGRVSYFSFSPDGREILLLVEDRMRQGHGTLYTMPAGGGELKAIANNYQEPTDN